jgi:hypothetical protein
MGVLCEAINRTLGAHPNLLDTKLNEGFGWRKNDSSQGSAFRPAAFKPYSRSPLALGISGAEAYILIGIVLSKLASSAKARIPITNLRGTS